MTPYLPPREPRCRGRLHLCGTAQTCGRNLAELPVGATVRDYTHDWPGAVTVHCGAYVPLSDCKVPPGPGRAVHGAVS